MLTDNDKCPKCGGRDLLNVPGKGLRCVFCGWKYGEEEEDRPTKKRGPTPWPRRKR